MRHRRSTLVLAALVRAVVLTLPAVALADDTVSRTFPFRPGDLLEIETAYGGIEYRHGGSGEIAVTIISHRGAVGDHLDLEFDTSDGLRIEGKKVRGSGGLFDRLFGGGGRGDIEFIVEGPEVVDLDLQTSGGDIDLADIEGEVHLATSGGNIRFGEVRGAVSAATSGGNVGGDYISGKGSLATSGGNIRVEEGGSDLSIATSGGNIEVGNVAGKLSAATSGGNIRLGDIEGDVSARTSGGSIRVGMASGRLEVATSGGDITVAGSAGDARLATSGGDITLERAGGHVKAATSGGDLTANLEGDRGADLAASGGTLTVKIPSGFGFDVDADADGGSVRAEVSIQAEGGLTREDRIRGTIRGGGNLLHLRNEDGDIRILEGR